MNKFTEPSFKHSPLKVYNTENSISKAKTTKNRDVIGNQKSCASNLATNEHSFKNVTTKIEITEHDLEIGDMPPLEGIHKDYDKLKDSVSNSINYTIEIPDEYMNVNHTLKKRITQEITQQNDTPNKRKKRKCAEQRRSRSKTIGLEKNEELFIRLQKFDTSVELNQRSNVAEPFEPTEYGSKSSFIYAARKPQSNSEYSVDIQKPTNKVRKLLKNELQKKNPLCINKTESLKMEELILKTFKKSQETRESAKDVSEESTNEFQPYFYEKTDKSLYETYELIDGADGRSIVLKCLLCPFTCLVFKKMALHYKFKHRNTPIEEMHFCSVKGCSFKAVHKGIFSWHMKRHMLAADKIESDLYRCDHCDKVFDQRKGFLIHLKHMHRDPSPVSEKSEFPCATCNFTTTNKFNLRAHVYRHHIPADIKPILKCNTCEYETHYSDCFRKHTRMHSRQNQKSLSSQM